MRARIKAVMREGGFVRHDRLLFRIAWDRDTVHIPSEGHPVMLQHSEGYSEQYPKKRINVYRYPKGEEYLGYAEADSREIRG